MRLLAAIPFWYRIAAIALASFALRQAAIDALKDPPPSSTLLVFQSLGWLLASVAARFVHPQSQPLARPSTDPAAWIAALLAPTLAFAGFYLLELSLNTGGKESFLVPFAALHPILTIALAILFRHERPSLAALLLFGLTLLALALASINPDLLRGGIRPKTWMLSRPWLHLAAFATLALALPPLVQQRALQTLPPTTVAHIHAWVAASTLVPTLAFSQIDWRQPTLTWIVGLASGVLAAAGTLAALTAFKASSGPIVSRVTAIVALAPALSLLFGELSQTHSLRTQQWIAVGAALVAIAGFALESQSPAPQSSRPK